MKNKIAYLIMMGILVLPLHARIYIREVINNSSNDIEVIIIAPDQSRRMYTAKTGGAAAIANGVADAGKIVIKSNRQEIATKTGKKLEDEANKVLRIAPGKVHSSVIVVDNNNEVNFLDKVDVYVR